MSYHFFLREQAENISESVEREESDHGQMLQRVVSMQDLLLSLGIEGVNDWLKAAERP